jgi:hypothetical protein
VEQGKYFAQSFWAEFSHTLKCAVSVGQCCVELHCFATLLLCTSCYDLRLYKAEVAGKNAALLDFEAVAIDFTCSSENRIMLNIAISMHFRKEVTRFRAKSSQLGFRIIVSAMDIGSPQKQRTCAATCSS